MTTSGLSVSVVIPVYNPDERYLRLAVASALAQTAPPSEIIIVDDGSKGDVSWIASAFGGRIRFLRRDNGGPGAARNTGILVATGELIAFLDGDDIWEPDKLRLQLEAFREEEVGLVYSPVVEIDPEGREVPRSQPVGPSGRVMKDLFRYNFVTTSTVVVRRRCLDEVGLFDEDRRLAVGEDYDLWLRIADRFEFSSTGRATARYRVHPQGQSRNVRNSYEGERLVVDRALERFGDRHPSLRALYPQRLAALYFEYGWEHFDRGELARARAPFRESLRHGPLRPKLWAYYLSTFLRPGAVAALRRVQNKIRR